MMPGPRTAAAGWIGTTIRYRRRSKLRGGAARVSRRSTAHTLVIAKFGNLPAVTFRGDFDLDPHLGPQQAGDHQDSGGGPDVAQMVAAYGEHGLGVRSIHNVIGRPHHV